MWDLKVWELLGLGQGRDQMEPQNCSVRRWKGMEFRVRSPTFQRHR